MGVLRVLGAAAAATVLVGGVASCADSSKSGPARAPGPTSTPASTAGVAAAQVKRFAAYTDSGSLAVAVAARTSGYCWSPSIAVPDPLAFRCLAGNDLLDPCFASPRQTSVMTVACVTDPWSGARLVTLTKPLPTARPVNNDRYWALELSNGARCVEVTGTVPTVAGVTMGYVCGGGMAAGDLHEVAGQLTAQYGSLTGTTLQPIPVVTAWTG